MIDVKGMTLTYPSGKGVFDLTFCVKEGEITGYLGPNGAGKTTTIRALMGFMQPNRGICTINGLDCYSNAAKIKENLGYIPGEISFPSGMNCMEFLKYQCTLRGVKDYALMNSLIERFELDTKGKIKRFSKGMKQKVGIITAFMHDPKVLILDEPTSGLDPLMQNAFIDLVLTEKKKGKTILMSSHMFEEVERTCDNVLIIKDGIVKAQSDVVALKSTKRKGYIVHTTQMNELKAMGYETYTITDDSCEVYIKGEEIDNFIKNLCKIKVNGLDSKPQHLEDIFLNYYGTEGK